MAFGRDRTEQILAMQQLAENEQKLERVIEGSDQGYWDWNLQTNQFQVSARWETMLGYEPGEMDVSLEHWPDIVYPDDLKVAMTSIQQHLNGRFSLYVLVNIFIPPDNHDFASSRRCSFILNQAK